MNKLKHDWKRYLCPREERYFLDPDGFLISDESTKYFESFQPNLKELSSLRKEGCVVILGEPGIGKSTVLEEEYQKNLKSYNTENEELFLLKNLNNYSSDMFLVDDIFKNSTYVEWLNSEKKLNLYLDSLDEGLLNLNTICNILLNKLGSAPRNRMYLKISCRTGAWPISLEEGLADIFKSETETNINILELVPLTREDIEKACDDHDINKEDFLKKIIKKGIVPLAIKPNTLDFLIMTYKDKGTFPKTRIELYREGCELHSRELNKARVDAGLEGSLSSSERMVVAARIAALMIFGNKSSIYLGTESKIPENAISVYEITGGASFNKESKINLTRDVIKEVTGTGLFTSRGLNLMGWAHQSYAEFLASYYIKLNNISLNKMKTLFFDSVSKDPKIIPSLTQVASWLAPQSIEFCEEILRLDPETLLRSDLSVVTDSVKKKLIEILVKRIRSGKSGLAQDWELKKYFVNLKYEKIEEQLRPYLSKSETNNEVKNFAIDLSEECGLEKLCDEILKIALDESEPRLQRVNAAYAVKRFGNNNQKLELRPLLMDKNDDRDELKGVILSFLWPDLIGIQELLSYLTPPKDDNFLGSYGTFLVYNFGVNLKMEDLNFSLRWARENINKINPHGKLFDVIDSIIEKSWPHLSDKDILNEFSLIVLKKLEDHRDIVENYDNSNLKEKFIKDLDTRKKIFINLLYILSPEEIEKIHFTILFPLINGIDPLWIFELFETQVIPIKRRFLASFIRYFTDVENQDHLALILRFSEKYEEIKKEYLSQIGPVELGSKQAIVMKENYESRKKYEDSKHKEEVDWKKRVSDLLDDSFVLLEKNIINGFYQTLEYICVDFQNGNYHNEILDINDGDGWKFVDKDRKEKILIFGKRFLADLDVDISASFESNSYNKMVMAGIKFLRYLVKFDPDYLKKMDKSLWEKWTPPLLIYPVFNPYDDEAYKNLIDLANVMGKSSFRDTVKKKLLSEGKSENGNFFILDKIKRFINLDFAKELFEFVENEEFPVMRNISILGKLIGFGVSEAEDKVKTLISSFLNNSNENRGNIISALSCLFWNSKTAGWDYIYPIFLKDMELVRDVFLNEDNYLFFYDNQNVLKKLSDKDLTNFYRLMVMAFPYVEDNINIRWVGPNERAERIRSIALTTLKDRGSVEACEGLRQIVLDFPQYEFLRYHLIEAENWMRVVQWNPPNSAELIEILKSSEKRLVRNYEELSDCIMDSLRNFEQMLHGKTAAIADIWNTDKDRFRPKNENEFSDRVKRFLEDELRGKGIIANREVEIRGSPGGARTDIEVRAWTNNKEGNIDNLTMIIETKGCWHPDLYTAMESQLAFQYLRNNHTKCGIFLVGNFLCDIWDSNDPRKKKSEENNLEDNFGILNVEADFLNNQGYFIRPFIMKTSFRI